MALSDPTTPTPKVNLKKKLYLANRMEMSDMFISNLIRLTPQILK